MQYEIEPFQIKTMTMGRVFIDKLFAAEAYTRKFNDPHRAFEAAKHIYDLSVIENHPEIVNLYQDSEQMKYLLQICLMEEQNRLDGVPGIKPSEFFQSVRTNEKVRQVYEIM